jgi:hypothetical protein
MEEAMKKTVFISSTFEDLAPYRRAVWDLLETFDVNVRGMEQFGARPETPLETCIAEVEQSDIFIGIIAYRLGSVENKSGKSFTQLEYDRAYELNKSILIYMIDDIKALVSINQIEFGYKKEKLDVFKKLLRDRHTVESFNSPEDLVNKLTRDFKNLIQRKTPETETTIDEFSKSTEIIRKFLLIPKNISGQEIRVKLLILARPYSASKYICKAFNLEFGSTIGIRVQIINPTVYKNSELNELYIGAKQSESFLTLKEDDEVEIYAKLLFTENHIENVRANFQRLVMRQAYTSKLNLMVLNAFKNLTEDEEVVYEPEGKIILLFTKQIIESK